MHDNAESRWWQNRANRYAEQVENLQAEVAYQTGITDRIRDAWAAIKDRPISLPMVHETDVDAVAFAALAEAMRNLDGGGPDA